MVWRKNNRRFRNAQKWVELHPDEILLDVHNLPEFDEQQFEGRMERPISKRTFGALFVFLSIIGLFFLGRLGYLQIVKNAYYTKKSEQNSLQHIPIFAERGVMYDRKGIELAWNEVQTPGEPTVRNYIARGGFANLLGYVSYPAKDDKGFYWQTTTIGRDGAEKELDAKLAGTNGTQLIETDVSGQILSKNTIEVPTQGENVSLSIDADLEEVLFNGIKELAEQSGYRGGAGGIMDIETGELLAITSFPEYDQRILSQGGDKTKIKEYLTSPSRPFLNRMTEGLYTPGSIVKPFMALAALQENVINPQKIIISTGELRVPNPYYPGQFTIFKDNAVHGAVDMKRAIAVSSNVYFYEIGGGFGDQEGLGIDRIDKYMSLFGIGSKTGIDISGELSGAIPSIAWKAKHFPGDPWRIGDTYNTSIGQYGYQVTPLQMLRAVASVASRGYLATPTILKKSVTDTIKPQRLPIEDAYFSIVHDGMRRVVTEGTGGALQSGVIHVAAKTGTAQIKSNTRVNSWAIGFFPLEHPKYAFTVLMEDGPLVSSGATHAFKKVIQYIEQHPDEYREALSSS